MDSTYSPSLPEGTRVRLILQGHRQYSQLATVKNALPNPSQQHQRQWYDVRFDNAIWGRFRERDLEMAVESGLGNQAAIA